MQSTVIRIAEITPSTIGSVMFLFKLIGTFDHSRKQDVDYNLVSFQEFQSYHKQLLKHI